MQMLESTDRTLADALAFDNTADVLAQREAIAQAIVIALHFPKWTDGRAYSQARLLRSRAAFRGRIVATGEVLVDMLPLLQRCGFDAVVLRAGQSPEAARRALSFFEGHYQADLISKLPRFARVSSSAGTGRAPQPEARP